MGAHPHFSGKAKAQVRVDKIVQQPSAQPLHARLLARIDSGDEGYGEFQAIFDCANFFQFGRVALPAEASIQVAAFAHELAVFASEEEYFASQPHPVKFASKAFGQPAVLGDPTHETLAVISGRVREGAVQRNEVTGAMFSSALVESLIPLDVVIDTSVAAGPPPAGSIIKGTFWLSARIEHLRSIANPLRKLASLLRSTA